MATNTFVASQPSSPNPRHTDPLCSTARVPGLFKSLYFNGNRTISGWVRNASEVAQAREMVLMIEPEMLPIARTRTLTAAPFETDYSFPWLQDLTGTNQRYMVIQRPEDFATAAQARNGLLP